MNSEILIKIITIIIMIIFSAYFSATETAFSSINKTRLKTMAEKGDKKAKQAYKLSEKYDKLISTILVGNNIVNIAASSVGTVLFMQLCESNGATISTIVITIAVLIFGEITPKSIAKDSPENFSMFSAPFIRILMVILTPVNFLFSQWKKLVSKLFGIQDSPKMSQEELLMLVEEVQQEGSIDTDEGDLIKNAIEFTDRKAEDILTHRVDIEAVPVEATKSEIAELFTQTQFSRLLVYNETIDNIVGVIHLKDFYDAGGVIKGDINTIITSPVYIQKSEKISDILKILQTNKSHMAVVIDEYGGTLGIVTMEDILEELVGEIWDEHDEVVEDFRQINDDTYIVDASVNFDDFCEFFDFEAEAESVSVGGWVMEELGKIAEVDDTFEHKNLVVKVTETDSHRVTLVEVKVLPKPEEDEDEEEDE